VGGDPNRLIKVRDKKNICKFVDFGLLETIQISINIYVDSTHRSQHLDSSYGA